MFTTPEKLKSVFAAKGYKYSLAQMELNIVGIRSATSLSNSFDDRMILAFLDKDGNPFFKEWPMTTDPGKPWLIKPIDPEGCAVMVPGQYVDAYQVGIHGRTKPPGRQYEALEQISPIKYVRDNNKDSTIDFSLYADSKNIFLGLLKTNIHRASQWALQRFVETYSAGCQVLQDPADFNELMGAARTSRDFLKRNKFTYTLLEEKDFK